MRKNIWAGILSATDQEIHEGMHFYEGAHGLCRLFALAYSISPQHVAGIYAALSPMNGWDQNVANILEILRYASIGGRSRFDIPSPKVNTTHINRDKAIRIAYGSRPESVLRGDKVTSFYRAISNPSETHHIPVDRHLINLALGEKITSNIELRSRAGNRVLIEKIRHAYLSLGAREGIGNRLASIAWFVQRRISLGQKPILYSSQIVCCNQPMHSHGHKPRRWYCPVCRKSKSEIRFTPHPRISEILVNWTIIPQDSRVWLNGWAPCISLPKSHSGSPHPYANSSHYQYLARYVVMWYTGEVLRPDEHVHHIDGNKLNCKKDNLEVLLAYQHGRLHGKRQSLYMLRDVTSGRFIESDVPSYSEQVLDLAINHDQDQDWYDEVPF